MMFAFILSYLYEPFKVIFLIKCAQMRCGMEYVKLKEIKNLVT